jgi:hypothetical protein
VTKNPVKPFPAANTVKEAFGGLHYDPEIFAYFEKYGMKLPESFTLDEVWKMMGDNYLTN